MGVAPPKERGSVTSIIPGDFGGNLDLKELTKGATLFLPSSSMKARCSPAATDTQRRAMVRSASRRSRQALERHVRDACPQGRDLTMPRAETDTHYICMGIDPDLDEAAKQALREMIKFITERTPLSAADAIPSVPSPAI